MVWPYLDNLPAITQVIGPAASRADPAGSFEDARQRCSEVLPSQLTTDEYAKQRISIRMAHARYSAMSGVSRGCGRGRRRLGQVPDAM